MRFPPRDSSHDTVAVDVAGPFAWSYIYDHFETDLIMPGKRIPAGAFKARCLKLMDHVAATGEAVTVTKHGIPVVCVVPAIERPAPFVGRLAGTATHIGDITSPIGDRWDAARGNA